MELGFELASVIEFIHTATLLHDDVVDNSKKEEENLQQFIWDNKSSILVGDYLLRKAFRILLNEGSIALGHNFKGFNSNF